MQPDRKIILIVRDGWGYSRKKKGNCTKLAYMPNERNFEKHCPWTALEASGNAVGVPKGTQGGSEPGHLTMGAGRVVWQPLEHINIHIRDGNFFKNPGLLKAVNNCKKNKSSLHLMGLFSDQGIHGTVSHLYALLNLAKKNNLKNVYVHAFLDGRDVPERSASKFLTEFMQQSKRIGVGRIASMIGRYYAMDRDKNYDRTRRVYDLLANGAGFKERNAFAAIKNAYARGDRTDYYIRPIVMVDGKNNPIATVKDHDSVIFWDYRSDRSRQITYALTAKNFPYFKRRLPNGIVFVCMSQYDEKLKLPVAFMQTKVSNNLGQVLAGNKLRQLRIAETEKYAHVTFFFNSQEEIPNKGEDRILVPSPKIPSYDLKPEMSAYGITEKLLKSIITGKYDFILVNFANGDLVGHSGNIDACIRCCEVVDECVGKIVRLGFEKGYTTLLTGDHGNVENMYYPSGEINPSHGLNPVPFYVISNDARLKKIKLRKGCGLKDVAPTVLDLMGLKKPNEMNGKSLIV